MIILPTFLESSHQQMTDKLAQLPQAVTRIHIDVIEPAFADNQTLYPADWPDVSRFDIDVHLMVTNPVVWVKKCLQASTATVVAHIEQLDDLDGFIIQVKNQKAKVGLAIDLPTELQQLSHQAIRQLHQVDQILLLGVKAGYAGQRFDPSVLKKITWLRQNCSNSAEIIIDGGITGETAKVCSQAGASGVAVNSWLWEDVTVRLEVLHEIEDETDIQ